MTREEFESGKEFTLPVKGDSYKYRFVRIGKVTGQIEYDFKIRSSGWARHASCDPHETFMEYFTLLMGELVEGTFNYKDLRVWS